VSEVPTISATAGLHVGEYVLDAKIGQGAFGEVWKAHHRAWTDQMAAVKIPTDPTYVRHLQSEGFSLHRLNHASIVRVMGFDPAGTPPYMVSELVNGPSLRQVLQAGKLPTKQALAIMRQVLTAIDYAHQRNVVHGDIKPENVLIAKEAAESGFSEPGCVKITDFGVGLAAAAAIGGGASSSLLLRGGDRSSTIGTLRYIAPEQREGAPPDAKSDIFACGVLLFELLTGDRPAGAESPSDLNPQVPAALDEVFRKAYARRDRRFGSAQDFLNALTAAEAGSAAAKPAGEEEIIGFRSEDELAAAAPRGASAPPPAVPVPVEPASSAVVEATPTPAPAGSAEPPAVKPQTAVVAIMDELARRPVRSADELRALFRKTYITRALDESEVGNLKLRLNQWSESAAGLSGFAEQIEVTEALDAPYYRVMVRTQYEKAAGAGNTVTDEAVILANPAAAQNCNENLEVGDFGPVVHLSARWLPPAILEMVAIPTVRTAIYNLLNTAKAKVAGRRLVFQELKITRATVLSLRYRYDGAEHGVCFVGNSLKVVGQITPVAKMRDDLLKRAAALLDTENIGAGIGSLRQVLQGSSQMRGRAERMLVALRAKLSAAYVSLAGQMVKSFGILESLEFTAKSAELLPGNDAAGLHQQKVYKLAIWVQTLPSVVIALVFVILAIYSNPLSFAFIAAAVGSLLSGYIAAKKLGIRWARTDAAFCHACLLPLAIVGVVGTAPTRLNSPIADILHGVLLIVVVLLDVFFFKKMGADVFRWGTNVHVAGEPLDVLAQIELLIEPDWQELGPHYLSLEPLSRHASATLGGGSSVGDFGDLTSRSDDEPAAIDDQRDDLSVDH
jgi:serine/threonine protein kinase